jgi:predicted transcriptional regulator
MMNFNIDIDDKLGERLIETAKASERDQNAVIIEAISLWLDVNDKSQWPDEVMQFEGVNETTPFEFHRKDLATAETDPFV